MAVSGDHEIETDRRVAVSARLEILRMERRAQHADERAYRGSDKAHDPFSDHRFIGELDAAQEGYRHVDLSQEQRHGNAIVIFQKRLQL